MFKTTLRYAAIIGVIALAWGTRYSPPPTAPKKPSMTPVAPRGARSVINRNTRSISDVIQEDDQVVRKQRGEQQRERYLEEQDPYEEFEFAVIPAMIEGRLTTDNIQKTKQQIDDLLDTPEKIKEFEKQLKTRAKDEVIEGHEAMTDKPDNFKMLDREVAENHALPFDQQQQLLTFIERGLMDNNVYSSQFDIQLN